MVERAFLGGRVTLHAGDCKEVMAHLPAASFDSCICDPPYHLTSIVKRFGQPGAAGAKDRDGLYRRASAGFMGKQWDGGDVAFRVETWGAVFRLLKPGAHLVAFSSTRTYHRMACAIEDAGFEIRDQLAWMYGSGFPKSRNQHGDWEGWGTALKPAWEPIVLARKPLDGTVAQNLDRHGAGALNIDGCRVETDQAEVIEAAGETLCAAHEGYQRPGRSMFTHKPAVRGGPSNDGGRWPANVLHDGSDEVVAGFPDGCGQAGPEIRGRNTPKTAAVYGRFGEPSRDGIPHDKPGSASRFFYSAKADADDRIASKHPTVKPVDLMQWLVRLVTPKGGLVLDPFAGTGTTGEAAWREGMRAVLIEREAEYQADIARRMALATEGPDGRRRGIAKARGGDAEPLPLFGGAA